MELGLAGLSAVVTGGSAGIGSAIVRTLAGEGCNVAFCARTETNVRAMEQGLSGLPGKVSGSAIDVTDSHALSGWIDGMDRIDILIANVSAISPDWQQSFEVDIMATVNAIEAALPALQSSSNAAITYIGSLATDSSTPGVPGYGAAKKAMEYHIRNVAREYALQGIRANIVSPGTTFVEGGWWDNIRRNQPDMFASAIRTIPLGRMGTGDEIARVVAFISSPVASFVAGANWFADGAQSLPTFADAGPQ